MVFTIFRDKQNSADPGEAITSPDFLGHKPKNKDVVRIGRRPLIFAGILLSAVAAAMIYTMVAKSIDTKQLSEDGGKSSDIAINSIAVLEKKPRRGLIGPEKQFAAAEPKKTKESSAIQISALQANDTTSRSAYDDAEFQLWQQRQQEKLQLEQARRAEYKNALNAESTVYTNNQPSGSHELVLHGSVKQDIDYSQPQQAAVNIPQESAGNYLLHTRVNAASPLELKAGTVIPSVMLGGVNSDLPGQIMAQVSQNVYDSASGRYLLIPQGTKLVGTYDHQIVQGQNRVLVVWHHLVYPDASAVNLENMAGADQSGYAGFKDKVNTHFWPTFRNALMLSAITAGALLSQPRAQNGSAYSSQQMIAAAMGMQMNNLGMLTINRNLNRVPTIQIRPGYIFNVLINKDMVLPLWPHNTVAYGSDK